MNISVIYLGTKGAGPIYSFEMVRELVRRNYNINVLYLLILRIIIGGLN